MIKKEITRALKQLGYSGYVKIVLISCKRYEVFVDGEKIGIYDLNKHSFVD